VLEIWLDRLVLLVEEREIRHDILDDVSVGEGVDLRFLLGICWDSTQACQGVDTINVHRTTSANSFSATPSEGQGRVNLILDPNERIQHHRSRLVQIEGVALHAWLRGRLIGIPAVDVEGLDFGIRVAAGLLDCRRLRRRDSASGRNRSHAAD